MAALLGAETAALLSALRILPVWLLTGLAVTCWLVLAVPSFGGVDIDAFRKEHGGWFLFGAICFTALAVARITEAITRHVVARRSERAARRVLTFAPVANQTWWHLARQQDLSEHTQVSSECLVTNSGSVPLRITNVEVFPTKGYAVRAFAFLASQHGEYGSAHPAPARGTTRLDFHAMISGRLQRKGAPLRLSVRFTDSSGEQYTLRRLTFPTRDKPDPMPSLAERVSRMLGGANAAPPPQAQPHPWTFEFGHPYLDSMAVVLGEERRNYAARGRTHGLLGSLNINTRSEPGGAWTREGQVKELLWDESAAQKVSSPLLDQLLGIHGPLSPADKDNAERYLLTLLNKTGPYASIAYFIFVALHRLGRTTDALEAARSFLAGDTVHGYSNLLAALSGLISHEHATFSDGLLTQIMAVRAGDEEYDFYLREKINSARLRRLGGSGAASEVPGNG